MGTKEDRRGRTTIKLRTLYERKLTPLIKLKIQKWLDKVLSMYLKENSPGKGASVMGLGY